MIPDKVQERLILNEFSSAPYGMCVTPGLCLGHEGQSRRLVREELGVRFLIARPNHDGDVIDTSAYRFPDDQAKNGTLRPLPVKKCLHRKIALRSSSRRDDRFSDLHLTGSFGCSSDAAPAG